MADIHLEKQICNLQAQLSTAHAKISLLEAELKQTAQTPLRAISGNEMLHSLKLSAQEGLSMDEFNHFSNFSLWTSDSRHFHEIPSPLVTTPLLTRTT